MLSTLTALGLTLLPSPIAATVAPLPAGPAQSWQEEQTRMDRNRRPLIHWQRSLDDALALSRRTGRPMLVCVNLDGENASEAYAHSKYKNPDFVALIERYVPLIISPNRHNPADYDEKGRRIQCPRFGTVTCGEHIRPEQRAYELYFSGQRYAPRHVGVAPEGTVLFDRYLDQDLANVDRALRKNVVETSGAWRDLLLSRDAGDRARLERAYLEGDKHTRLQLLIAARASDAEPYDLLRLGLADEDPELRQAAMSALSVVASASALDLVLESLADERLADGHDVLARALDRLSRTDARAKQAAHRRRALKTESKVVRVRSWAEALAGAPVVDEPLPTTEVLGPQLDELLASEEAQGSSPEMVLKIADTHLGMGKAVLANGGNPTYFFVDADDAARRARDAGADTQEVAVVAAQAAWLMGEPERAGKLAVEALPALIEKPTSRAAAEVLGILGSLRVRSIYAAENAGVEWPEADLADAIAAYDVLAAHPYGNVTHVTAQADLLATLNLSVREASVLRRAFERFASSPDLHARYRAFLERTRGVTGFTEAYDELRASSQDPGTIDWFAGYAELIVAESHMRNRDLASADEAYTRSVSLLDRSVESHPDFADSVDHFVALALAGQAQILMSSDDLEGATERIIEAIERRPASAESKDGLERTPYSALRRIHRAAKRDKRVDLEELLASRLGTAAPEVWGKLGGGS